MSGHNYTLLLRLAGPMQSWGTASRFQLRRTDLYPSKSGVLGLLLCARGIRREDSSPPLRNLARLQMGVRVDRQGTVDWDYHTAGAKIGIRSADGEIKRTQSKSSGKMPPGMFLPWVRAARRQNEYETLLSRRQYLYDASFLVALQGDASAINEYASALDEPAWPLYLGRKCCVPSDLFSILWVTGTR
ncbi:MAG: type I-E CRISPR-associated protein Cas5/CasD [Chloroflexi bacterium]|nr:type I-E CRISPR-associated protein Cas5/CasD [Chloroflexota bacterium]